MVKTIKPAPMGVPDIVRFHDLTGPGPVQGVSTIPESGAINPLHVAKDAVNSIDQWINLADKGITMLGRADSILSRIQSLNRPGQQAAGAGPAPVSMDRLPPGATRINSDPVIVTPELILPAQVPPGDPPGPAAGPGPVPLMQAAPAVNVAAIIQALDMIASGQPGISVEELSAAIKRNPVQVQHIMDTFAAGAAK